MVSETVVVVVVTEVAVSLDLNRSLRVVDVDDLVNYLTLLSVLADDVSLRVSTCSVAYHKRLRAVCRIYTVPLEVYPRIVNIERCIENAPEISLEIVTSVTAVSVTHKDDRTLVSLEAVDVLSDLLELSVLCVDVT